MARRECYGDRERLEDVLTLSELQAIAEQCRAHDVPLALWHMCAPIARAWEGVAVKRRAIECSGASRKDAVAEAARYFGLSPDTMQSRFSRWIVETYRVHSASRASTQRRTG